jgi:hypothetical protein
MCHAFFSLTYDLRQACKPLSQTQRQTDPAMLVLGLDIRCEKALFVNKGQGIIHRLRS